MPTDSKMLFVWMFSDHQILLLRNCINYLRAKMIRKTMRCKYCMAGITCKIIKTNNYIKSPVYLSSWAAPVCYDVKTIRLSLLGSCRLSDSVSRLERTQITWRVSARSVPGRNRCKVASEHAPTNFRPQPLINIKWICNNNSQNLMREMLTIEDKNISPPIWIKYYCITVSMFF